jgi:hypothetical protein
MPFFRPAIFRSECDACHRYFPVNTGGVCEHCRRILCADHLHGSITRRLAIAVGAPMICVDCRGGAAVDEGPRNR